MIGRLKGWVRRHWPRLRLRTILLLTFLSVAALPGVGALFLRVYENTLVRQTEAELVAQGAALAAAWPGAAIGTRPLAPDDFEPEVTTLDLRTTAILPERPAAVSVPGSPDRSAERAADALLPIIRRTQRTTLAAIQPLDAKGRLLVGPRSGWSLAALPEVRSALAGHPTTVLRRNADYSPRYSLEWLSRASNLRIHHARPVRVDGRVVGVLLLSRSPRALFRGIYEDRGKIMLGVVLILLALIGLSGLLSRGIARPIEALSAASRRVARGQELLPEPPPTAAIEIQALWSDFRIMAHAIERRSRYLRDFAHAVSHEFKTPIAGITGALELLADHGDTMPHADRARFLSNATADAERLARLSSRLLELARADMARPEVEASCDPSAVARQVAEAAGGGRFAVLVDGATTTTAALSASALEAVLTTLVENSRQAGAGTVFIDVAAVGSTVRLLVSDDGGGVAPGDRDRLFEPFFTSRRETGGTGLGLPIARSLMEACGGGLELVQQDGGAVFEVSLVRIGSR